MIDKTYINFYANWYYKKIGDEYQAREAGANNIGVITEIVKCPIDEFIKKLTRFGEWKSAYEFPEKDIAIICEKYPYIKYYHREILISKIKRPIVFSLFVTSIKNNDCALRDFIIHRYNLTENDAKSWELETIPKYDMVMIEEVKYGETYYLLENKPFTFPKTAITYKTGDIYTIKDNVRYILSAELIKQLDEATNTFYKNLNEVFTETNGYHIADFGDNRFIGYKQVKSGFYHFIVIKKSNDGFTYLYQQFSGIQMFLEHFDFSHWGVLSGNPTTLKEDTLPLYLSAKACGDKFLEYEIKFLTFAANQSEIDYLNEHDPETATQTDETYKRFYLKKEVYDLEDIEILGVSSCIKRWYRRVNECEIIIDGKKVNARFSQDKLIIQTNHNILICKLTSKLTENLRQRFAKII